VPCRPEASREAAQTTEPPPGAGCDRSSPGAQGRPRSPPPRSGFRGGSGALGNRPGVPGRPGPCLPIAIFGRPRRSCEGSPVPRCRRSREKTPACGTGSPSRLTSSTRWHGQADLGPTAPSSTQPPGRRTAPLASRRPARVLAGLREDRDGGVLHLDRAARLRVPARTRDQPKIDSIQQEPALTPAPLPPFHRPDRPAGEPNRSSTRRGSARGP
jgi:hypothetical protein